MAERVSPFPVRPAKGRIRTSYAESALDSTGSGPTGKAAKLRGV